MRWAERSKGQFPQRSRRKTAVFGAVAQSWRLKLPPPLSLPSSLSSDVLPSACAASDSSSLLRCCPRNLAEHKPGAGIHILAAPSVKAQPIRVQHQRSAFMYTPITLDPPPDQTHTHTVTCCIVNILVLRIPLQQPRASISSLSFLSGAHSICRGCSCTKARLLSARLASFMFLSPFSPFSPGVRWYSVRAAAAFHTKTSSLPIGHARLSKV